MIDFLLPGLLNTKYFSQESNNTGPSLDKYDHLMP